MNKPDMKCARVRTKEEVKTFDFKLEEKYNNLGNCKTYFVKTYGCQMNVHDGENICAILEAMGYTEASGIYEADLVILNTCAIRENAHNKTFGMIGRIKNLKETRPEVMLAVCGCMAQEEVVIERILDKCKWIDLVFGTHNIVDLPKLLDEAIKSQSIIIDVKSIEGDIIECVPAKRDNKYKAWVNVQYGCDKFCTYCIVPFTRGKQRSRTKENILKEVRDLKHKGYVEITLLGQNVNAYGYDIYDDYNMGSLLEDVALMGIKRIRFMTSHPWDFNDEMISIISKYDNIMPYIHLPVQSGSNKILKVMGRKYTKESYLELVGKLKAAMPNCTITTDIIVGFPGETEEDFMETIDVVNKVKYDAAYTFLFSKRVGTPAYNMEDDVDLIVKNERLQRLNSVVKIHAKESNEAYLGKTVKVLIEHESQKGNRMMGYTDTAKFVDVDCSKEDLGKIINVKITSAKTWCLEGSKED